MQLVLSLTPTPPANAFVTEAKRHLVQECYPLDVFFCEDCTHVQLIDVVDPSILFADYVYVSGTSPEFVRHFESYAKAILASAQPPAGALVVDIGSNDGTLLRFFKEAGCDILGIDPARDIALNANQSGIETWNTYFSPEVAARICLEKGKAHIVTANNVFAHIDDMVGVTKAIRSLLADGGVFVFEVSYLVDVFEKTLFDTVYHEHLSYHSVKPLQRFLAAQGLELIDAVRVETHGGSLRGIAQLAGGPRRKNQSVADAIAHEECLGLNRANTLRKFSKHIIAVKDEFRSLLQDLKRQGKSVAGFGAPAKATTLMYHFGIGPDVIDFIVDDSQLKQGLYSPGMHIPVVPSDSIYERRPDFLVVLAWNFAKSIMAKHTAYHEAGGRFIVPLPTVKVY